MMPENRQTESGTENFSQRKEAALRALLTHKTVERAAAACGCNERTLRRWLKADKKFVERYRREQDSLLQTTVDLLRGESASAVATLASIAKGTRTAKGAGVRVQAAKAILAFGFQAIDLHEVERRLTQIEEFIRSRK